MKTKTFKRIVAATAALMMMSAVPMMSVPGVWADTTASIKITSVGDTSSHSFSAYQIFTGDASKKTDNNVEKDVLSNIKWGSAVVKSDTNSYDLSKSICTALGLTGLDDADANLSTVLNYINTLSSDADMQAASRKIYGVVKEKTATSITDNGTAVSVNPGYYLIIDTTTISSNAPAVSANMMKVVGDETLTPKVKRPTLEKYVQTGVDANNAPEWGKANTKAIGDIVNYKLTSTVPDVTGYNEYYFVISDVLSAGLKLEDANNDGFTVKVGGSTLSRNTGASMYTAASGYYVEKTGNGQGFKIVFNKCATNFAGKKGSDIEITYSAKLEGDNVSFGTTTSDSNTNKVDLTYSNNPNETYNGISGPGETPSKPYEPEMEDPGTPNDPTDDTPKDSSHSSQTPDDKVYTYTTKLKVTKTKDAQGTGLNGAGFTLYKGQGNSKTLLETIDNADGNTFVFLGLEPGAYTLEESTVPDGYNKAADITFTIKGDIITADGATKYDVSWSDTESNITFEATNKEFETTVLNQAGTTLPSTGGIGTTIFYVSGGSLILGAVVVMITKKRMSLKEDK